MQIALKELRRKVGMEEYYNTTKFWQLFTINNQTNTLGLLFHVITKNVKPCKM